MKKSISVFTAFYFKYVLLLTIVVTLFSGCKQLNVFEKSSNIPQYKWAYNFQPEFEFAIQDTSASYKLFVVMRHTDAYRYNNIWLNIGTQIPGDSIYKYQRVDFQLGTDANGWEGTGMDDIWELRKPISNGPVKFVKPGNYKFKIAQVMRENPLSNILSVGIRVEIIR